LLYCFVLTALINSAYPYIDMIYSLSDIGHQLLDATLSAKRKRQLKHLSGKNTDHS